MAGGGEQDAYAVLQVDPRAEQEVIAAAYRALARRYHPDGRDPDLGRMATINRAYDRLRTPERRQAYDRERPRMVAVGPGRETAQPAEPYDPWTATGVRATAARPEPEVLDFGRYAGWRIADIARHDPDYLRWLSRHSTGVRFQTAIARCLPADRELGRRASWLG